MSLKTHGARLTFSPTHLVVDYSELSQSLGAPAQRSISLADIRELSAIEPTDILCGSLTIHAGEPVILKCAPGEDPKGIIQAIEAAQRGEAPVPASTPLTGLDFTAVDVETANDSWGSICAIGAVRFRDGQEVESRSWLCTPPPGLEHFLDINISIHGIKPQDVKDSPSCAEALAELVDFVGTDTVVAHNAQFDSTAVLQAAKASSFTLPKVHLACSLALARYASKQGKISVDNHKLPTVATAMGCAPFSHHDATEDARAAGLIISGLAQVLGHQGNIEQLFTQHGFTLGLLSSTHVMPVLASHTAPVVATDLGAGTDFRSTTRLSTAAQGSTTTEPTAAAKGRRRAPWDKVATPDVIPAANPDADPQGPLFGHNVTLTGDFEPFDKGLLWNKIAAAGAEVGKSVTKKTTILVIGTWASVTSKEKRAKELIAKGQEIQLWTQSQLLAALSLEEQPPF